VGKARILAPFCVCPFLGESGKTSKKLTGSRQINLRGRRIYCYRKREWDLNGTFLPKDQKERRRSIECPKRLCVNL
jgi:hypothetical protein